MANRNFSPERWGCSWEHAELSYALQKGVYILRIYSVMGCDAYEIKRDDDKGDTNVDDARCRTISEMGSSGWELVSVVGSAASGGSSGASHAHQVLYFKRLRDPDRRW